LEAGPATDELAVRAGLVPLQEERPSMFPGRAAGGTARASLAVCPDAVPAPAACGVAPALLAHRLPPSVAMARAACAAEVATRGLVFARPQPGLRGRWPRRTRGSSSVPTLVSLSSRISRRRCRTE